jgi:hypothetical protein
MGLKTDDALPFSPADYAAPFSQTDQDNIVALAALTKGKQPAARASKRTTAAPVVTEEDVTQTLTAKIGDLVSRRRWFCTDRPRGCRGAAPFLSWKQLLQHPTCPNCGSDMFWHQGAERVKK